MKTHRRFSVLGLLAVGLLAVGLNVKAADVAVFQGKFTLTSATRWGQATLPAGEYSFTLDHAYPGSVITVHCGTRTVAQILAPGMSSSKSGRSEMVAENGTVREVNLPTIGVRLEYAAPKFSHRAAPQEPLAAQIIPVATKGAGR